MILFDYSINYYDLLIYDLKIVLLLSLFLLEPKDNLLFLLLFDAHFKMVEFLILIYYATKII